MLYLYVKSFHLIFLIAWMVSLLYLPRLYVYHSDLLKKSSSYNLFLLMEKRLLKIIAIPSMFLTLSFGFILIYYESDLILENYFRIKLFCVFLLIIYQMYLIYVFKTFKVRKNKKSGKYYKFVNEVPTVLLIIIILLVVLKPNIG